MSRPHLALTHDSVFRRDNSRIAQIGARQCQRGSPGVPVRAQYLFLGIQDGPLAALRFSFRPAVVQARDCAIEIGLAAGKLGAGGIDLLFTASALREKTLLIRDCLL